MLKRNRSGCKHVIHIMFAEERTLHQLANFTSYEVEPSPLGCESFDIFSAHACTGGQAKRDDLTCEVTAKLRDIFVIRVQHSRAAMWKRFDQFIFRTRNSSNRIETFEMHGSYVGDHSFVR